MRRTMEHRLSQRIEGQLPILVYKKGMPVGTGKIRDASRRGVFITTDYSDVRLNQTIQLAFRLPEVADGQQTLNAHVVRRAEDGLGLDFDGVENNAGAIFALILWLNDHSSTTSGDGEETHRFH
ncbi:MAG: PilZ domain-containing protein [Pseudomonadota bacterium]